MNCNEPSDVLSQIKGEILNNGDPFTLPRTDTYTECSYENNIVENDDHVYRIKKNMLYWVSLTLLKEYQLHHLKFEPNISFDKYNHPSFINITSQLQINDLRIRKLEEVYEKESNWFKKTSCSTFIISHT